MKLNKFLEMMVCSHLKFPNKIIRKTPKLILQPDIEKFKNTSDKILKNIHFLSESITFSELETKIRSNGKEFDGVAIDLFDYILTDDELKTPAFIKKRLETLRNLCISQNMCCIVLNQIRRIPMKKNPEMTRPSLMELKNAGGFEEVADLVLLLHRNKYYHRDYETDDVEIHIAKQREGLANTTVVHQFQGEYSRIGKHRVTHLPFEEEEDE